MDLIITVILFLAGLLGGFYGSSAGSGALVTFSSLILVGIPTHIAIATNRLSAVFLELSSSMRYYKERKLNIKLGITLGVFAGAGSFIGSNIVVAVDAYILNLIIAFTFLILAILLFGKNKIGVHERVFSSKSMLLASVFTFLLGIYGGFFGGGFGTFIAIILVLSGFTALKSAAIGRVVGLIMSLTATVVFAYAGLINLSYGLSLGLGSAIGAWIGAGYAIKKGSKYIKSLIVIITLLTVLKMLFWSV